MKLYQEDLTQEQFNTMMARIDEILREAQKIIDEAKEAEKVATGISNISVSEADEGWQGLLYRRQVRKQVCQGSCHHQWQEGDFKVNYISSLEPMK